jgi:hypothetical protein
MKNIKSLVILAAAFALSACALNQAEASGAYIAAEVSATAILQKNPSLLPVMSLLAADWGKLQAGTLLPSDQVTLLQQIVAATKGKLSPTQAALLDGAVQQMLANTNATAPTPLGGAAAAIITDVMNGVARAVVIYQTPPTAVGS